MAQAFIMRTAKTLIRLGGCPGWSESSLGAHSFCWFCRVAAHFLYPYRNHIHRMIIRYECRNNHSFHLMLIIERFSLKVLKEFCGELYFFTPLLSSHIVWMPLWSFKSGHFIWNFVAALSKCLCVFYFILFFFFFMQIQSCWTHIIWAASWQNQQSDQSLRCALNG